MKPKAKAHSLRLDADVAMLDVSRPRRGQKAVKLTTVKTPTVATPSCKLDDGRLDQESTVMSSASKKRRRRSAAEIDRKFKCPVRKCSKAYGSEGSLIHHQRVKHPELAQAEAQEKKETQVGTFLLPLHNAPRNVAIRPATPLLAFAPDPSLLLRLPPSDPMPLASFAPSRIPPFAKELRGNMRSRSNSEPVTGLDPTDGPVGSSATPRCHPIKARARTPRSRRGSALHSKGSSTSAERTKLRSKSESLPELLDERKVPVRTHAKASVRTVFQPIPSGTGRGHASLEWPVAPHMAVPSADQVIDRDILSVLAYGDPDEVHDLSELEVQEAAPLTRAYPSTLTHETELGLECFSLGNPLAENPRSFGLKEPEAELGLSAFAALDDDWTNDTHLSTHLEKMSMAPAEPPVSPFPRQEPVERPSDPTCVVHAAMACEATPFASTPSTVATHELYWHEVAAAMNGPAPTSAVLDALLQHDDAVDWKANGGGGKTEMDFALDDTEMSLSQLNWQE